MGTKHERLSDQVRRAIDASGRARHAICRAAKVDPAVMSRFMAGVVGLSLPSLEALVDVLDLELVPRKTKRSGA